MEMKNDTQNRKGILRFILLSLFGIFMFFVKIPYQDTTKIPIDIIVGVLREKMASILPYIVLLICIYGVVDTFFLRKTYKKSKSDLFIACAKVMGMLMVVSSIFQIGPAVLIAEDIGPYTVTLLGGPVGMTLFVGSLFLPFLIEYGLAEAAGVLMRPIMRPIFKLPGRVAVVCLTSFFGNYSLGHIGVERMLKQGQVTHREAVNVATGFGTASIVTLMVYANMVGIMDQWGLYVGMVTLITFLISAICVRIYPIRKVPDAFYDGVTPDPEPVYSKNLLKNAIQEGINAAERALPVHKCLLVQLKSVINILGTVLATGMFFMAGALLLQKYTPVTTWIGYIFWPFFKLVGMPNMDVAMQATGLSVLDQMLAVSTGANALAAGVELAATARFYLAIMPVAMIVFLSGFIPCILSTEMKIKFHELIALWFVRVVLTIVLVGVFGMIFL